MNRLEPTRRRIKLQPDCYFRLCRQVLERDNWRCQNCGRGTELQIHHIQFRSHLGDDREGNLESARQLGMHAIHYPAI